MGFLKNDSKSTVSNAQGSAGLSSGGFNAILDQGSEFEGKLSFEGVVRIDGLFKGEVFAPAHLVVGPTGKVVASINVDVVTISGQVEGDIVAKTRVELQSTAHVKGNIFASSVVVEDGAIFDGKMSMSKKTELNGLAQEENKEDKLSQQDEGHA
ncbi:polymer-forming cytoskeletal protein [bacterium]|nr:polymer-forming cytoskeletal protein [bacterium]